MSTPPPTPVEKFSAIIRHLSGRAASRTGWALTLQLIALIATRLREIKQAVERIAARVQAGTYCPRKFARRRPPAAPRPRPASTLPTEIGWLLKLIPEAVGTRGWLEDALRDPEMLALMQAAPASLRRPIRSLCWMLRVTPPPILAQSPRPRPPAKPQSPPPEPEPEPPLPQPPEWLRGMPRSARWPGSGRKRRPLPRACGPPETT